MARHHVQALSSVGVKHSVAACYDVNGELATRFAADTGATAYDSLARMWREAAPDIVHIATPAEHHFEPAREALEAGAHIYIEKPFVETVDEASELLVLAQEKGLKVCAGYQQIRDQAFHDLMARAGDLAPVVHVDSQFSFNPARFKVSQATERMLAWQLLDILPHPLYTLVAAFEALAPDDIENLSIDSCVVKPDEVMATLKCGDLLGRLFVSLRMRPVKSCLMLEGRGGSLTADFARSMLYGAGNPGTKPLEKILNPMTEGLQQQWGTARSVAHRIFSGEAYPGLAPLLDEFYGSIADGTPCPLSTAHILRVVRLYEELAFKVRSTVRVEAQPSEKLPRPEPQARTALVTGAGGWLGREICRSLVERGFRVKGLGRSNKSETTPAHEWISADLGRELPPAALDGVDVVVHAAAETAGGFPEHQKNSVDATRNVLESMKEAGVGKLVYISSIAVLEPRNWRRAPLDEQAPLCKNPEIMGPYIWGKCNAEKLVAELAPQLGLEARVIRPSALVDWDESLPGRLGRGLVGHWNVCFGRPGLPMDACQIGLAGDAVAGCAEDFDATPPVVNLMDPTIQTRGDMVRRYDKEGWGGRVFWLPISVPAGAMLSIRWLIALMKFKRPSRLAVWRVLKPRRYDMTRARELIERSGTPARKSERADATLVARRG